MTAARKLARFGATFAFALAIVATTSPSLAFADEYEAYDPSAAPFVLETVNGAVQTAAGATEFGLGIGQVVSDEAGAGLGIGVQGTDVGAAAAGLGLVIPASIVAP
jgi:hypothetical protein